MENEQVEEEMNLGDKKMLGKMRYRLNTSVIKNLILVNSDLTMIPKCRTSDLESTFLKSRGCVILHRWSKFHTHW